MKPRFMVVVAGLALVWLSTTLAFAQPGGVGVAGSGTLVIKPLIEKKVTELPAGPLFWRVESFATLARAQAAAGQLGLVAESGGKVWLFTLGPAGGSSDGGTKMAEIGPLPPIAAPVYLLRVNEARGPSGSITPVHSHPGAEAAYVLAGGANLPDAPWHEASRCRQGRGRPRRRDADASLQQRLGGSPCAGHVRGRRHQAVLESGEAPMTGAVHPINGLLLSRGETSARGRSQPGKEST
jgi:hypothetical protein